MSTERAQRIVALKREYERQKEEWQKAKAVLEGLGDNVRFRVSARVAQMLEEATAQSHSTAPLAGVRA